jgi:hypothetical protein
MKIQILLIGDEKGEMGMFEEAFLQIYGINYAYVDMVNAFEAIHHQKTDIVFIGHAENPVPGLQLLSVIKPEPKLKSVRAFLYAANITEEISKMARLLGASGCIEKTNCQNIFMRELKAILDPKLLSSYIFLLRLNNSIDQVMPMD